MKSCQATSKWVTRMATLTKEREKVPLESVTDANGIEFVGGKEAVENMSSVIKGLGAVVDTGIAAEESIIEITMEANFFIQKSYSFKVLLVDKKGKKATPAMMKHAVKNLAVQVTGLSSKVKVFFQHCALDFFFVVGFLIRGLILFLCRPPWKRLLKRARWLCRSHPLRQVCTKFL